MPFDRNTFNAPATKGDVAGLALRTSMALNQIVLVLHQLQANIDATAEIKEIRNDSKELQRMFDDLTGWSAE